LNLSKLQQNLAWLILAFCLLAIPVGLFIHAPESKRQEPDANGRKLEGLVPRRDRLMVVNLSGMIVDKEGGPLFFAAGNTGRVKKQLRKALKDEHVKAVLIRINSPGGTVASSQEIHKLVLQLREKGKPVIASMSDLAASGGYYVACAADRIVAEPGTVTGSIGVIMNLFNLQGIEEKLGIQPQVVKSGQFKDMGSPSRAMTAEEKALFQTIIMDSYDQFVTAVASGRQMETAAVRKLADGRIYTGRQALELGLVDELGGYDQALAWLQKRARERYALTEDLPVDEGSLIDMLRQLLEAAGRSEPAAGVVGGLVPESMLSQFQKQPLWVMQ